MSIDVSDDPVQFDDVTGSEADTFPLPRAHGAAVSNHLADVVNPDADRAADRGTLYDRALTYWREHVGDVEEEPYLAVEDFDADWLPDGRYALILTSSRWKAGTGTGDDYRAYYEQHLKLREYDVDDGELQLRKPPLALHVEIIPQFEQMVYKSGDPLECPYGEGTRLLGWTTWAEDPFEIERRMYDALRAVYGPGAVDLDDRVDEARRLPKAEAHIRFDIDKKAPLIETLDQSKALIDWGGDSQIEAHQKRQKEGWLEWVFTSDRWHLLGFEPQRYSTEVKVYQANDWHRKPRSYYAHHPKLEASYAGVDRGKLPHVSEWDDVLEHLRTVVATHARWAGIERSDLIEDDYFDGPQSEPWDFERPTGRRQMLKRRYEDLSTDIYREALKESTTAVYDILRVIAEHDGANYDALEERTGLARSTVRYHVRRLAEEGIVYRKGNPVMVYFVSEVVLERAREILREVRPEDTPEDRDGRAEERRERREKQQEDADDDPGGTGNENDEDASSTGGTGFEYLARLSASIHDVAYLIERDQLDDRDVRVRRDDLPPPLR
ncbi:winged helix-turn-helix domain-containing protein [Natrarchaeobaculum sulfurireducens]|uniref:Protein containing HTH domain n=1 Tax=Natrarchaeobaculum sulfurireducens TaxID=2044521 RepID=A0A346PG37_9EURY|nr:winged helix-turn-helix domain-containing protein [Natrarchaeobaculum sulfurireducens]AXR78482.1 Protein containing HTH domain [Natrarchaeobaculum sulfurireducens]